MNLKQLFVGTAFTMALTLVIVLNENQAFAQTDPPGISCNVSTLSAPNSVIDNTVNTSCGKCTIWSVRPGWKSTDGAGAKYVTGTEEAFGTVITCKSSNTTNTCTATTLNSTVNCPAPPSDLPGASTGTGTGASTGH